MTTTYGELLKAIIAKKVEILSVMDKWHKLSGDLDALEYGHSYLRGDRFGFEVKRFSGRDWEGYRGEKLYYVSEHGFDLIDLASSFGDYASYGDLSLDEEIEDYSEGLCRMLEVASAYGLGLNDSSTDTNASRLLGFNPETRSYCPKVCCEVIED